MNVTVGQIIRDPIMLIAIALVLVGVFLLGVGFAS